MSILQALNMAMNESPKISEDVLHLLCVCVDHSKATNQPKKSALWSGYDGQTRTKQQFLSLQRAVERQRFAVYPTKGVFECNVPGKTAT